MGEEVYVRRVRDPNPLLEELARQAADRLATLGPTPRPIAIRFAAQAVGVPLEYVLDELERRVRAGRVT